MDGGTQVQGGGDVLGEFVVGDHNVTVRGEQSVVTVVMAGQQPRPVRRDVVGLVPGSGGTPIGRERELEYLHEAVTTNRLVQVYGAPGTGRSTLLRHVADRLAGDGPVVFLSGADRDVTDLLQQVFETCYDTSGYRPGPGPLRQLMTGVGIRLLIDDLDVTAEQLDVLVGGVPDAAVLFTGTRRALWTDGQALALAGLSEESGSALLARALDRPLREDERGAAAELWRLSDGSPLLLLRAVAGARRGQDGTAELPHPAELGDLTPRIMRGLTGPAREVASVLALAGFGGVAPQLLPWLVADQTTVPAAVDELTGLGVAVASDQGVALAPGIDVTWLTAEPAQLEWVAARLQEWARTPGLPPVALADHVGLLTRVVDATSRAGRPDLGAWLARAVAPVAACSLRLGAWGQILQHGIAAATQAGDRSTLACLSHEDGVRNLVIGKQALAANAVATAVALWYELGDTVHLTLAQYTQTLTGPPQVAAPVENTATPPTGQFVGTPLAEFGPVVPEKKSTGLGVKLAIAGAAVVVVAGAVLGVLLVHHKSTTGQPVAVARQSVVLTPPVSTAGATSTTEPTVSSAPPTTATSSVVPTTDAGPAGVVESYFAAINSQDYQTAWTMEGQYTKESYSDYVAGFAGTQHDTVVIDSVQGDTVVADLTAVQNDGTQHTYHGTYTVSGDSITHSSVHQTS